MNNYHMHMGATGCYSHTFEYEKKPDCVVCSSPEQDAERRRPTRRRCKCCSINCAADSFRLLRPSISSSNKNLFMQGPPALREATSKNLDKKLR
ncbi:hypothetical protein PINS_up023551 [Pythium insidiosum]|nr:hypothetical protein PINS_up023551 [Pythium insidiosum]